VVAKVAFIECASVCIIWGSYSSNGFPVFGFLGMEYGKSVANFCFGDGNISCMGCAIASFLVFIFFAKILYTSTSEVGGRWGG
jgi:hypothetical protein